MVNAWIIHVKEFAKKHDLSYGCAISTPECRQSYHRPARVRQHRERRARHHNRRQLSEEEEFYFRNPQLNIERMAGDYDY
jgi:hypothetical protein